MKQINARIWRDRDILGLVAGITAIGIFIGVCLCCAVLLISHAEADGWSVTDRGYIMSEYLEVP